MDTCREEVPGSTAEQIILQKLADGMIVHGAAIDKNISALLVRRKFPHILIGHPGDGSRLCWVDTTMAGQESTLPSSPYSTVTWLLPSGRI